jgi:hypothetical protein
MKPRDIMVAALLCSLVAGCSGSSSKSKDGDADAEIKKAFAGLQFAVKERNGEKIWDQLDADSRQDADRLARTVKDSYAKADEKTKAELAKSVGLPDGKLKDLSAKTFLESDLFFRFDEHDELPDVKGLDKVEVKGNTAKVFFKDPDKQETTVSMKLQREDNRWRFQVAMPKAPE